MLQYSSHDITGLELGVLPIAEAFVDTLAMRALKYVLSSCTHNLMHFSDTATSNLNTICRYEDRFQSIVHPPVQV
jgi:hypothetical protein